MGLSGTGKTSLSNKLAPMIGAVHFNADDVRRHISNDLGFSHADRIEQARRMSWLCDKVVEVGGTAIADFICPTEETRTVFKSAFTIWVDRIEASKYDDTNEMFVVPRQFDVRVSSRGTSDEWAQKIAYRLHDNADQALEQMKNPISID